MPEEDLQWVGAHGAPYGRDQNRLAGLQRRLGTALIGQPQPARLAEFPPETSARPATIQVGPLASTSAVAESAGAGRSQPQRPQLISLWP